MNEKLMHIALITCPECKKRLLISHGGVWSARCFECLPEDIQEKFALPDDEEKNEGISEHL